MKEQNLKKYIHFYKLYLINKKVLKRSYTIRVKENYIIKINNLLNKLNILINKSNNIESILETILNTLGHIHMYQPFFDGNTRTLFIYFLNILEKHNYKTIDNNYREYIPLFFYEYEYCTEKEINIVSKKIIKKQS